VLAVLALAGAIVILGLRAGGPDGFERVGRYGRPPRPRRGGGTATSRPIRRPHDRTRAAHRPRG
jgi:hypothetical protein